MSISIPVWRLNFEKLELSSDYYKAVFHLEKYPDVETEEVLINLIKINSDEQCILIAQRKAVDILGRISCLNASDAFDVYLEGLVINFISLLTLRSVIYGLWIVPEDNSLSIETNGRKAAPNPD